MTIFILPKERVDETYIEVEVKARIISAETAKQKASYFLAMNVGHLLQADSPELILDQHDLRWRLDVVLVELDSVLETVGTMYLSAENGSIIQSEELIDNLFAVADAPINH